MVIVIKDMDIDELKDLSKKVFIDTLNVVYRPNKKATLVGIKMTEDGYTSQVIEYRTDVYELLQKAPEAKNIKDYDLIGILTAGWAAPVNDNDNDEIAPSLHPDRRRVNLAMFSNSSIQTVSVMSFDDDLEEILVQTSGQGALQDEFVNALEKIES